jgi:lysophospholipase L1-like esterase
VRDLEDEESEHLLSMLGCETMVAALLAMVLVSRPIRVMPLGDSITYGFTRPQSLICGGYRRELFSRLRGVVSVGTLEDQEGHCGWTSQQLEQSLPVFLKTKPDVILLMAGANDIMMAHENSRITADHILHLVRTIHFLSPKVKILLSTLSPLRTLHGAPGNYNGRAEAVNQLLRSSKMPEGATLVNVGGTLKPWDICDHAHPNHRGYHHMTMLWMRALSKATNQKSGELPFRNPPRKLQNR